MKIDLNSDVGELPERIADGTQDEVMRLVTSVNVSCGAHSGDESTILATLESAKRLGLAVGAHPSYPDRAGFGRSKMDLPPVELSRLIRTQLAYLKSLASQAGVVLTHVKPHGALYNVAAIDEAVADAMATAVKRIDPGLPVVGLAMSPGLEVYRVVGLKSIGEAFIDRRYDPGALLRPRKLEDALITRADEALEQAISIVRDGRARVSDGSWTPIRAETLCIHSDTPGAHVLAKVVREGLEAAGVKIEALKSGRR